MALADLPTAWATQLMSARWTRTGDQSFVNWASTVHRWDLLSILPDMKQCVYQSAGGVMEARGTADSLLRSTFWGVVQRPVEGGWVGVRQQWEGS